MSDNVTEIGFQQLGIGRVLKHNQMTVPPNQREYAWEDKEVRTLFQDFARAIGEGEHSYFLGTIVTIPRNGSLLEVIDGQQRLATTTIFLSAIRDYLRRSEPVLSESIDTDFLTVIDRRIRDRIPRLRLNLDDNEFFRARLTKPPNETLAPTKPSHRLLSKAFDEATRQVQNIVAGIDTKDHGDVLNRWVDFIEFKALVILLHVPNAANAYRMFETLNDRGKRTSQSDLVKNYLFGRAGERITEVQQRWALMRGALETMEDDDITILFLRDALTVIYGFVREADVYEAVQNHAKNEQPVVTFAGQLENLANGFVATHNPEHERWNGFSDSTRKALEVLNLFAIRPMRPLILAIAHKFGGKEAQKAFTFCVSLGVRLMIGGRTRTGSVEEALADVAHKVFIEEITSAEDLRSRLRAITPSDMEFRVVFESATISNRKLARYYLRSLEMEAKKEAEPWHIPNDDKSVINLEHVLPEKPESNWPQFSEDEVKLYKNRIGNQALLRASENSDLKSIGFREKQNVYAKSPYILTSQIAKVENWTVEEIAARQKTLAALAVQAWPI
jgi:hypothetical protein